LLRLFDQHSHKREMVIERQVKQPLDHL